MGAESEARAHGQSAQSRAGSSAFASYKEKNEAPSEPATAPKLRIQKNNRETAQDNHLSLAPENISKWKRCDSQNAANAREDQEPAVNAQQNAQKRQPAAAKPSIEFQALWNELHKPQVSLTARDLLKSLVINLTDCSPTF